MPTCCRWLSLLLVPLALAAALPAQGKKPAPAKKPTAEATPPKDDKVTAKDPAIVAIDKFRKAKVNTQRADWKTTLPAPPELKFTAQRDYLWQVRTSVGELTIRLLPAAAPRHVASTIYLARCGFYDGLRFPRILKGFMAQGGSPLNTQAGNAGYTLDHEFCDGEKHDGPGVLSAANGNAPNTDGSQFFLTFAATPHLDGHHTVFGRVVAGLDVLQALEARGVDKDGDPLPDPPAILCSWIVVAPAAAGVDAKEQGKGEPGADAKGKGGR
jgi:peptidylprolyl isomerase